MMLLLFYIYLNKGKDVGISDLMRIVGYKSSGAIHNALNSLEFSGYIKKKGNSYVITEKGKRKLGIFSASYMIIKVIGFGLVILGIWDLFLSFIYSNKLFSLLVSFRYLSICLIVFGVFLLLIEPYIYRIWSKKAQK